MWKLEATELTVSAPVITDIFSLYSAVVLACTLKKTPIYLVSDMLRGEVDIFTYTFYLGADLQ